MKPTHTSKAALAAMVLACSMAPAAADNGGISFWLPGLFGSFAATPATPGWAFSTIYYHTSVDAGAGTTFRRGGNFVAGLEGRGDLLMFGPTYTFEQRVFDAQIAFSLFGIGGRNQAAINATLTGPLGNSISGHRSDSLTAFGDIVPQLTMKWNKGANNFLVYVTGDIPVGSYDPNRLANLGLGHGAIDGGVGYTYLNSQSGWEFSIVTGMTYNFKNTDIDYKNGIDWHVDWGISKMLTKQVFVGAVGYWFQQITGDSGSGAVLGPFKSRVGGIGPQFGYLFPVSKEINGVLNVKGYYEFEAEHRPEGWNLWVALNFSQAEQRPMSAQPTVRK